MRNAPDSKPVTNSSVVTHAWKDRRPLFFNNILLCSVTCKVHQYTKILNSSFFDCFYNIFSEINKTKKDVVKETSKSSLEEEIKHKSQSAVGTLSDEELEVRRKYTHCIWHRKRHGTICALGLSFFFVHFLTLTIYPKISPMEEKQMAGERHFLFNIYGTISIHVIPNDESNPWCTWTTGGT